ncbi:DUF3265 domain-containing protein (plasmid) [Vibrio campbellii]|nr:DUF3265 domain-containing protein [Vibrio campbellii]
MSLRDSNDKVRQKLRITSNLRGIFNAWHFYYALGLVFKLVCGSLGIALLTP